MEKYNKATSTTTINKGSDTMKLNSKSFKAYLKVQKERQLVMQDLSEQIGIDISFSEDEMIRNAEEAYVKDVEKQLVEELEKWMKLASF